MSAIHSALLEKGVLYLGTQKESFRELKKCFMNFYLNSV